MNKRSSKLPREANELTTEASITRNASSVAEITHHLQERTKELACLYATSRLLNDTDSPLCSVLSNIAELLPTSWQHPSVTHARISCYGTIVESSGFINGEWKQSAPIVVREKTIGEVDVFYSEKTEQFDEGPFLTEERLLIDAIAENIGRHCVQREIAHNLAERVKELTCFHDISEIIDANATDIPTILQAIANILPDSWQFPECTCAKITLEKDAYKSPNYRTSTWRMTTDIMPENETIGMIEVSYLKAMPDAYEGPFLKEERSLIDSIAERLGKSIKRISVEQQLEIERISLSNMNIAMKEVLGKVHEEKQEIAEQIKGNVDRIVMPILQACEATASSEHRSYLSLIRQNLEEIVEPYANRLSEQFTNLSLTEIQICNMVKNGLSSKDIASIRRISISTVNRHRENIRHKLGIAHTNTNLASYLVSFGDKHLSQ